MNWYKKFANKKDVLLKGKLCQNANGFVFLDLPNNLIHGLFPLIDNNSDDIEKPPYFGKNKDGAHISVINEKELLEHKIEEIKELGQEFSFKLGDFKRTKPDWEGVKEVFFVEVDAPELKELRQKYGLPATYKGLNHEFHFTIALRKKK